MFMAAVKEQVNGLDNSYFLLKPQLSSEPRGRLKPATLMVDLWERYADNIKMDREYTQKSLRKRRASGGIAHREQKHLFWIKLSDTRNDVRREA
jgi:hypothetical protein